MLLLLYLPMCLRLFSVLEMVVMTMMTMTTMTDDDMVMTMV